MAYGQDYLDKYGSDIILTVDELINTHTQYSYRDTIQICKTHSIEWKNQSIRPLVQELRDQFFHTTVKRVRLTERKREEMWIKRGKCAKCAKRR